MTILSERERGGGGGREKYRGLEGGVRREKKGMVIIKRYKKMDP